MSTDTRQRLQCCLAVCFLTCPGSVYARPLGASLTGQEILCETTTWGPSTSTPGIYAVAVDGQVTRVVTYGRRPLWAPNHRRFLYWREGAVWVADVQEHVTYEVTSLPASLSADALWMPDSDRLVYCGLGAPWPTVQPYSEVAQPGGAVPPTQLWAQAGERVGALSFAADSLRVAYEDGKLLPGLGVVCIASICQGSTHRRAPANTNPRPGRDAAAEPAVATGLESGGIRQHFR